MNFSKLQIADQLIQISSDEAFNELARKIFALQRDQVSPFSEFLSRINWQEGDDFPFVPIELFKHYRFNRFDYESAVFKSSGTTLGQRSNHFVHDLDLYSTLSASHFESLYGSLEEWVLLAYLPSYVENGDSSLVYMANDFISRSKNRSSSFIESPDDLHNRLNALRNYNQKTLLIGVSYALLDFAELFEFEFPNLVVMETGGMKGRKVELTRTELHRALKAGFKQSDIHSEYGMTELLSQAYSINQEAFVPPRWMRAFCVDISDPFHRLPAGRRGLLAFIDLANVHSCSFIQNP